MAKGKAKSSKNKPSKNKSSKKKPILNWREDAPHLTVVGALVGAVLFTLILGANLAQPKEERDTSVEMALARPIETDPHPAPLEPAPFVDNESDSNPTGEKSREQIDEALLERQEPGTATAASRQKQEPKAKTPPPAAAEWKPVRRGGLRNRILTDSSRVADALGWSLQFMVTCKAETAERVLADAGQDSRLYLLPVSLEGRDCYRVCWDTFSSREAAAASNGYPAALAALADPIPRPVAELR